MSETAFSVYNSFIMKKHRLLISLLSLLLVSCSKGQASSSQETYIHQDKKKFTMVVASDLHYLSPRLTDKGKAFTDFISEADGKVMMYSEEVMNAFIQEVISLHPSYLLLTGDLTYNGEKKSHEDLIKKLQTVEASGTEVLVLPGNHDSDAYQALKFEGDKMIEDENTLPEEFSAMYAPYGYSKALDKDPSSFSYLYSLKDKTDLLVLDTNSTTHGALSKETVNWLNNALEKEKENGHQIISATHQPLLTHNPLFTYGNVIENNKDILKAYKDNGKVLINLGGHLHIQSIKEEGDFREILSSSLMVPHTEFGFITMDSSTFSYEARELDVSYYYTSLGSEDRNLLNFHKYADDFFISGGKRGLDDEIERLNITDEKEKEEFRSSFGKMNLAYFAGDSLAKEDYIPFITRYYADDELNFFPRYLKSLARHFNEEKDMKHLALNLK